MSLNSQLRFNDDGTPRRRYELDSAPSAKSVLGAAIGLVLANAAMLVKNILFPAGPAQAMPAYQTPTAESRMGAQEPSGIFGMESANDGQPQPSSGGGGTQNNYQNKIAPRFVSISIAPLADGEDPIHRSAVATSHLAGNDNNALYGAAPGHGVNLPANDAIRIPASNGEGTGGNASRIAASTGDGDGQFEPGDTAPSDAVDPDGVPAPAKPNNSGPVVSAPVSLGNRFINQVIVIGLADLTVNATDADGDRLQVSDITPSSGNLTANGDGTWSYTPERGATVDVTFTYSVTDGNTAAPATAALTLVEADVNWTPFQEAATARMGSSQPITELRDDFATPIVEQAMLTPPVQPNAIAGTAGNDVLIGTSGNDVIHGGDGNDIINAGAGDDIVDAGAGDDTILAALNDGDDHYDGGDGSDTLDLTAIAPAAAVAVAAQPSPATLPTPAEISVQTDDFVIDLDAGTATGGKTGNDTLINIENVKAGAGNDSIKGDANDNKLEGGAGGDHIEGHAGNDTLDGGAGTDIVDGGTGDDVIIATADSADDDYHGGTGSDTYDGSHTNADAIIDLNEGCAESIELGHDALHEIEKVKAGSGNDTIVASDHENVFAGGAGDDTFVFHSTASVGHGDKGHDKILDFEVGDKIDISDISKQFAHALEGVYQDEVMQEFIFIQNASKFTKPGELKLIYNEDTNSTSLMGNIDYNDDAEFELEFQGHVTLTHNDFNHH